jgi:hypothetical protein
MLMIHQPTPQSEFEPDYNLERGAELNRLAGERDPAFKKMMEEGRAKASAAIARAKIARCE